MRKNTCQDILYKKYICLVGSKGARQGHLDQDFSHFDCRNGVNAVNATFIKTENKCYLRNICDTRSLFEVSTQFDVALQFERYSFTRDPRWLYYFLRFFFWFVSPLTWSHGLSSRLIRSLVGFYFTFDNYSSSIARSHWTSLLALIGETIFQAAILHISWVLLPGI